MKRETNMLKMKKIIIIVIFLFLLICSGLIGNLFGFVMSSLIDCVGKDIEVLLKTILFSAIYVVIYILVEISYQCIKNYYVADRRNKIKNDLFEKIILRNKYEFDKGSSAEYISYLTSNLDIFETTNIKNTIYLLELIISFVTASVLCMIIEPWMLVIMLGLAFITTFVTGLTTEPLEKSAKKLTEKLEEYTEEVKDNFSGHNVINAFNIEKEIIEKHRKKNFALENRKRKNNDCGILCLYLGQTVGLLSTIFVMAAAAYFSQKGTISIGMIIAFGHLIGNIVTPITEISSVIANYSAGKPIKEKFKEILADDKKQEGKEQVISKEDICVSGVTYKYDKKLILDNCSITIERNKKYVLLGNSGEGKSTFLNLIAGLYEEYSGDIKIGKTDIKEYSRAALAKEISFVEQNTFLFNDIIRNNITLFSNDFSEDEIISAINKSGLQYFIENLPDGLETMITENGNNLSGGEKQRISLARATLRKSDILLLDEYTSNLNKDMENEIENFMLNQKDKTIIVVTHQINKEKLKKFDVILELKNGKIKEVPFSI